MMIYKIYLIIQLMFLGCTDKKKYNDVQIHIKEIIVFLDFQERGYTTAGAYSHFNDLERNDVETVILSEGELNSIESVLKSASRKKHWQTKLGGNLIFCKVKYANNFYSRVVISMGKEKTYVSDLTRRIDFEIREFDKRQLLKDIFDKLK